MYGLKEISLVLKVVKRFVFKTVEALQIIKGFGQRKSTLGIVNYKTLKNILSLYLTNDKLPNIF